MTTVIISIIKNSKFITYTFQTLCLISMTHLPLQQNPPEGYSYDLQNCDHTYF